MWLLFSLFSVLTKRKTIHEARIYVYFNFFYETVNSHNLETANHVAHIDQWKRTYYAKYFINVILKYLKYCFKCFEDYVSRYIYFPLHITHIFIRIQFLRSLGSDLGNFKNFLRIIQNRLFIHCLILFRVQFTHTYVYSPLCQSI